MHHISAAILSVFELISVLISVQLYVYGEQFVKLCIIDAGFFNVFGLISVLVVFAASLSPLALIFAVLSYVPTSNLCLLRLTFVLSVT